MEVPFSRSVTLPVEQILQEGEPALGGTQTSVKLIIGAGLWILESLEQRPQSFLLGLQGFLQLQEPVGEGLRHLRQSMQLPGQTMGTEPGGW